MSPQVRQKAQRFPSVGENHPDNLCTMKHLAGFMHSVGVLKHSLGALLPE